MELEGIVLERVRTYEKISRWEKSELGRDLRRLGLSYGEIMQLIPVKKSTLATWCRDVKLTDEQVAAIKKRRAPEPGLPRDTSRRRKVEIAELREIARDIASELAMEPEWVAGLVLYWAEGAKTRGDVSMANTDPRALRLFIGWLKKYVDPDARFSLRLHLHEGNHEPSARRFWRIQTGLASANFHKTYIKPQGTGHRNNRLKNGICTVKMRRGADAWNVIMEWIDSYADRLGLSEPPGRIGPGR